MPYVHYHVPTTITESGHFWYFLRHEGLEHVIIEKLWESPNYQARYWDMINTLANYYPTPNRAVLREKRLSFCRDITVLIQDGWVIRQRDKIFLNAAKFSNPGTPTLTGAYFPEPEV